MKSTFILNLEHRLGYHETVAITRDEFMELAMSDGLVDELEDSHSAALEKQYDTGHEDGFEACKTEEITPLLDQIWELLSCHDAPKTAEGKKLRAELPEAFEDLRRMAEDMQKRLKLC